MLQFVESKVNDWSRYVELLSSLATDQPQAAYIGLTRSLQSEWLFLQRVTPNCGNLFNTIENVLSTLFIPSLLGHNCSPHERLLFSLPVRMGGLNIQNPMTIADFVYYASRSAVQFLVDSIQNQTPFCSADHYMCVYQSQQQQIAHQKERNDTTFRQQLNSQIGFNFNTIQRWIPSLNPQIGFNVNSIQRWIQPLNPQIGFNVNSIQRRIQPLKHKWDSTSIAFKDRFNH